MNSVEKNDLLRRKKEALVQGAGAAAVEKRHSAGQMTARERIAYLFDENSFIEIDAFAESRATDFGMDKKKVPGDGVITGYGTINGKYVYVSSQDFTIIGGSLGEMHAKKITKVMDMALKMGCPFVSINDSGGARIQEGVDALKGYGDIFFRNTIASGVIPQISVIMGPCAGGAVYSPAITDFIFMVQKTSYMCITGTDVIKATTGEIVTSDELGGADVHNAKSGVAHFQFANETDCLDEIRRLLNFLPENNLLEGALPVPVSIHEADPEPLNSLVPDDPNKPYDMKALIETIVDNGDFLEIQQSFAPNIIIGFGRLQGKTVGFLANQPRFMAGVLDVNSADKGARFIRFCDSFNIPVVSFTDTPGYLPGVGQEHSGVIRHGAKLLYAFAEATVPKINIITRKAYGGAYIAMNSKHLGADIVMAWPTAEIAVMGAAGAANIIFRKEISAAENQEKARAEKIEEYREKFSNPYVAAARGYVDEIIEPRETRARLISSLDMLETKRETRPTKKHGNIPL